MTQKNTKKTTRQDPRRNDTGPQECPRHSMAGVAASAAKKEADLIRILLVDDHPIMRQLISATLDEEADMLIIGEAVDGKEAIDKARQLRPDLILMDFSMPGIDGIEATRIIHSELPDIRIIGLSLHQEENRTARMLETGAATYVCKDDLFGSLVAAIRQVCSPAPD